LNETADIATNSSSSIANLSTETNTSEMENKETTTSSLSTTNTSRYFSINTDMMKPVLYLIDPVSDKIITIDLSLDAQYPNGSMPLHTLITPDGKKAYLSTMSSDTAPATILALRIGQIDWNSGKADVTITNVMNISQPGAKPLSTNIQNLTSNTTQPVIAKMWIPNNIQIHGPTLHPSGKFAYFTQWTDNKIRVIDVANDSLASIDPIQIDQDNTTQWLHGVFFSPSGDKALAPHYFFDGNHVHLFDVNKETGDLTNPQTITLGNNISYAAFPHFVTWINDTHAITSTQHL
jgi:DNA-binding beta-propeller fold protein YncE